jgi:hypothetical protein
LSVGGGTGEVDRRGLRERFLRTSFRRLSSIANSELRDSSTPSRAEKGTAEASINEGEVTYSSSESAISGPTIWRAIGEGRPPRFGEIREGE